MQDDAQQERGHEPINDVQRLQLELLRRVHYNLLDGKKVVDDLLTWRDLWYGVIADRCADSTGNLCEPVVDLIRLRDIPRNYWNVDCVFIWTNEANAERLRRMLRNGGKPTWWSFWHTMRRQGAWDGCAAKVTASCTYGGTEGRDHGMNGDFLCLTRLARPNRLLHPGPGARSAG